MSLATLKRKTEAKYNNMSVNTGEGFSLNGTRRNQGYVGQTSSSRSLTRGLRNGQYLRGHGSCCSTGTETPITQNEYTCLEDNTVIKRSSLSMMGMLKTRYCNNTCNIVKPDTNNNTSDQSTYITKKIKKTINEINKGNDPSNTSCTNVNTTSPSSCVNKKNVCENVRPEEEYLPISSSQYTEILNSACQENDVVTERPTCGVPLPGL